MARVDVPLNARTLELVAHELEHVLEQVDGVNLAMQAALSRSLTSRSEWRCGCPAVSSRPGVRWRRGSELRQSFVQPRRSVGKGEWVWLAEFDPSSGPVCRHDLILLREYLADSIHGTSDVCCCPCARRRAARSGWPTPASTPARASTARARRRIRHHLIVVNTTALHRILTDTPRTTCARAHISRWPKTRPPRDPSCHRPLGGSWRRHRSAGSTTVTIARRPDTDDVHLTAS